ncbi:MAG: hypothetical protein AAF408_16210, partial [Pseudomonadota bacterium]
MPRLDSETFNSIIEWIGTNVDWRIILFCAIFLVCFFACGKALKEDGSRRTLTNWVKRAGWRGLYRDTVLWLLNRSDRWFTATYEAEAVRDKTLDPFSVRYNWSGGLLDRAMLLAVLYPFLALLVQWAASGGPGMIGGIEVVAKEDSDLIRIAILSGAACYLFAAQSLRLGSVKEWLKVRLAKLGISIRSTETLVSMFSFVFLFAGAGIASYVGTAAFAVAFALAVSFVVSDALSGTIAFVGAIALACAFLFAGANVGEIAGGNLLKFVGVYVGAAALATLLLAITLIETRMPQPLRLLQFVAHIAFFMCVAVWYVGNILDGSASLIILIAALPIVNAIFDFLSLGVTRFTLRRGIKNLNDRNSGRTLLWGVGDLGAAAVLFAALGCSAIAYIHLLNSVAAQPLLPLGPAPDGTPGLFDQIRENPGQFWWLYATFLTTLLPT